MFYLLLSKIKKGISYSLIEVFSFKKYKDKININGDKNKISSKVNNPPKKKEDIINKSKNKDNYIHILNNKSSEVRKNIKDKKKEKNNDKKKDDKKKVKNEDIKYNNAKSKCIIISKNTKVTRKNVNIRVKGKNKLGMQVLINSIKKSKEYLINFHSEKFSSQNLNSLLTSKKKDKFNNFNYSLIKTDININKYLQSITEFNDYDDVIEEDKRTFCEYYKERIADKQMIINTFFISEDIKPKSIKISIFILTIDLYILLNGLFYSDSYISKVFNSNEKETFFSFITRSIDRFFYSTMAGKIIEYIIKFLIVEEITIHKLLFKKRDEKRSLKYDMSGLLKSILKKIRILIIISYIIIIFSWYYISCFNNCYPNIKKEWIISSVFIIMIIQILPFIFCFLEASLRFISIIIKSEKLFKLSLLFP